MGRGRHRLHHQQRCIHQTLKHRLAAADIAAEGRLRRQGLQHRRQLPFKAPGSRPLRTQRCGASSPSAAFGRRSGCGGAAAAAVGDAAEGQAQEVGEVRPPLGFIAGQGAGQALAQKR